METVWREFTRRLDLPNVSTSHWNPAVNVPHVAAVDFGPAHPTAPLLAITSWANVLSAIEAELADEPQHRNDLLQLRALCDAADNDASTPFTSTELTSQRTPAFMLHLSSVVQRAVTLGVAEGVMSIEGRRAPSSWERVGRYIWFPKAKGVDAWFGTDFRRWRERGATPLWLVFFGRALDVRPVLEPWAEQRKLTCAVQGDDFAVGIDVVPNEERDHVIRSIVNRLRDVATELSSLPARPDDAVSDDANRILDNLERS